MTITCYKSLFNPKAGDFQIPIEKAFKRIKNGSSQKLLEQIRNEQDKDARNELKKSLPCYLFSGTFSARKDDSLIEHSGLICLDFDGFKTDNELKEWRKRLESDEFTLSVFTSPSGNGLKSIVKIPKCDKDEHKLFFIALEKYYECEYFDKSCKNISRACFESYDPNIFINMDSKTWTEKSEEEGYQFSIREPQIVLSNTSEIINRLLKWWNREFGLVEGERNNNLFILASSFNEYGIDQYVAESTILSEIVNGSMPEHEVLTTIKSAYKARHLFGTKYFEDRQTFKQLQTQVQRGVPVEKIKDSIPQADDEIIDSIQKTSREIVFWQIIETQSGERVVIDNIQFKMFLEKKGFFKFYQEKSESPIFINIKENIVRNSSATKIKDFVLDYLLNRNELQIWNMLASSTKHFSDVYLSFLESIELQMMEDEKDTVFLYYQNGVVEVKKDNVRLMDYIDCNGYVWQDQIILRDYETTETDENDFRTFVSRISGDDVKRVQTMETTLGYLMSSHKDKTDQKSIIFNDQEISDGNPNGGSGKSLLLNALGQFKKLVTIDGKSFDANKSDFVYQRVNLDTQILAFDDVKRKFNFESLFSLITEGITVNRKNKDEIFIPFEKSPKVIITTNYVIDGSGSSHDRRRHEVELFQYFNQFRTPLDEFGKLLFDQWDSDEWHRFDSYMINCCRLFLKFGLMKPESINANTKRFIQSTSKDFYDFILDDSLPHDCKVYTSDIVNEFKTEFSDWSKISNKKFTTWVKNWCDFKGYEYEQIKNPRRGFMIITKTHNTVDGQPLPF
jgi:hypothetical protein